MFTTLEVILMPTIIVIGYEILHMTCEKVIIYPVNHTASKEHSRKPTHCLAGSVQVLHRIAPVTAPNRSNSGILDRFSLILMLCTLQTCNN